MNKLRACILVLLAFFMKVKSVLFSEMRNKLGDQIVGTGWKGRMVFRAYKVPANPQTNPQKAHRAVQKAVLQLYQANVGGDATKEGYWNTDALPRAISGYNLFMKLGRSNKLDCLATQSAPTKITGHYTVQTDLADAYIVEENLATNAFTIVAAPGTLSAGDDVAIDLQDPSVAGSYAYYIGDQRSKNYPPTNVNRDGLVTMWEPDETNGVADPAICVVS